MSRAIAVIYSLSILLSAFLLFAIQPLFAKMLLPLLGGTSQVWNTCMLFFQLTLLAGYVYAHFSTALLGVKKQAFLHLILAGIVLFFLPIRLSKDWIPPSDSNPVFWLLGLLTFHIGLPFFILSANSPLIQKWFSETRHRDRSDPYFLYAASNFGSLTALLGYPFLIEPFFKLGEQTRIWSNGYLIFLCLAVLCIISLFLPDTSKTIGSADIPANKPVVPWRKKLSWIVYALVPASIMYGVTTYLSTDIAAFPLLWIIPLSIYLLTFIFAFSKRLSFLTGIAGRIFPLVVIPLVVVIVVGPKIPIFITISWTLFSFFIIAQYCHGCLAGMRPEVSHLTEYYLWLSAGGVLGGVFNALLAPLLFSWPIEYQIGIIAACILRTRRAELSMVFNRWFYKILPASFGIFMTLSAGFGIYYAFILGNSSGKILFGVLACLMLLSFFFRGARAFLSVLAVCFLAALFVINPNVEYSKRSYFGVHRVKIFQEDNIRTYLNGSTVHGVQSLDPDIRDIPTTYYHPKGPVGDIVRAFQQKSSPRRAAVIGLGVGSLAAYGREDEEWTFYEIDPVVRDIALNPELFTFLHNSKAKIKIEMGDGRLSIAQALDGYYGLIVVDAFSSDSIPVHLITKEAIELFLSKLTADGILVFHISNRHINLGPVLTDLANAHGLLPLAREDLFDDNAPEMRRIGKKASAWFVMVRRAADLGMPQFDSAVRKKPALSRNLWTDDYSNIAGAFKWK